MKAKITSRLSYRTSDRYYDVEVSGRKFNVHLEREYRNTHPGRSGGRCTFHHIYLHERFADGSGQSICPPFSTCSKPRAKAIETILRYVAATATVATVEGGAS